MRVLTCTQFLERHSEYLDGVMMPNEAREWEAHCAACEACARYDRVLRKGVTVLASEPIVDADAEFMQRLRYRLADEEYRMTVQPIAVNTAATVSVLAMLALVASLPVLMSAWHGTAASAAARPANDVVASEIAWHGGDAVIQRNRSQISQSAPAAHIRRDPGTSFMQPRYSPVIIDAPTAPPSYSSVSLTSLRLR